MYWSNLRLSRNTFFETIHKLPTCIAALVTHILVLKRYKKVSKVIHHILPKQDEIRANEVRLYTLRVIDLMDHSSLNSGAGEGRDHQSASSDYWSGGASWKMSGQQDFPSIPRILSSILVMLIQRPIIV